MSDNQSIEVQKVLAARELLSAARRNLQLVDLQLERLQGGRIAVQSADDVSSEHRVMWLGAVDAVDGANGIRIGDLSLATSFGFQNPKLGAIRNQEDAAFVCTNIFVAQATGTAAAPFVSFSESEVSGPDSVNRRTMNCSLRLTDGNTGRSLIVGMTTRPTDLARGAVPFSYISSIRPGLGSNVKNKLFSEFTIPRAGVVTVEVFNNGAQAVAAANVIGRVCVSLFGYKAFGG